MYKTIDFPCGDTTESLGRNGTFKTSAVEVADLGVYVMLTPYTGKKQPGRCSIQIPANPAVLDELIATLTEIRARVEEKQYDHS